MIKKIEPKTAKKELTPKRKVGRPSKYGKIDIKQVEALGGLGLTAEEIALVLDIGTRTFYDYMKKKEFSQAIKKGRTKADLEIISSLRVQAKAGNVTAIIFWLKNRQPAKWHDRREIEHRTSEKLPIEIVLTTKNPHDKNDNRNNNKTKEKAV